MVNLKSSERLGMGVMRKGELMAFRMLHSSSRTWKPVLGSVDSATVEGKRGRVFGLSKWMGV